MNTGNPTLTLQQIREAIRQVRHHVNQRPDVLLMSLDQLQGIRAATGLDQLPDGAVTIYGIEVLAYGTMMMGRHVAATLMERGERVLYFPDRS